MSKKNKSSLPSPEAVPVSGIIKNETGKLRNVLIAIIFIYALLLYANTIKHDYTLDDVAVIQQNKFTKQGFAGIDDMLHTFYWQGYWDLNAGLYRPLSLITFAIEYQFFKDNPHISHSINIVLYAVDVCLLFLLLIRLLPRQNFILAFLTTLLFVAHPLHTEVVANIKSRDELLCLLFFLLTMLFLLDFIRTEKSIKIIAATCCYFLALFSKEGAIIYLAVIPLTLYFFTDKPIKKIAKTSSLFLIPAIFFLGIHTYVISHAPTARITYSHLDNALVAAPDMSSQVATAVYTLGRYFKLLIYPHPLSYDYSFNEIPPTHWGDWKVLLPLLIAASLIYFAIKGVKKKSLIAFGIIFFFITISLVSNIFMLIGSTMADRFLFVPSLGFCLVLSLLICQLTKTKNTPLIHSLADLRKKSGSALLIIGVLLALYSFKTITRNNDWATNFTLFKQDVKASPNSSRTNYNYGTDLLNKFAVNETDTAKKNRLLNEVLKHLEISAKIDNLSSQTFLNLASTYYQKKNYAKAVENATRCLQLNPKEFMAYSILGNAYYRLNNFDKAIESLNKSIAGNFVSDDTYNFLGGSYFGKQDFPKAIEAFNKCIKQNPKDWSAHINLGGAYGMMRDYSKAITVFKKCIELDPLNQQSYYYLSLTFTNMGEQDSARVYQEKLNALKKQ